MTLLFAHAICCLVETEQGNAIMLKHSEARSIAESLWGTGGTHSYRTNRRGAFYFSCSGHGGYVIDSTAFSGEELAAIAPHVSVTDTYTRFSWVKYNRFHHSYKRRATRYAGRATITNGTFLVFEEDCDWSIVDHLTGIHRIDDDWRPYSQHVITYHAAKTFERWIVSRSNGSAV